jgi:hypothetical protein
MKETALQTVVDHLRGQSERQQLEPSNTPVLPSRQP